MIIVLAKFFMEQLNDVTGRVGYTEILSLTCKMEADIKLKKTELQKPTGCIVGVLTVLGLLNIKIIALLMSTGSRNGLAI